MTFIISMNIKGLGANPKYLALKEIFYSARPKIILIQETMHSSQVSIAYFRRMFPSWFMVASEACGQSGGLAVLWDPVWIKAKAFKCFAGILISALVRGQDLNINILNAYVPYKNRLPFWERLFASEILEIETLMIAGDLNMTLSSDECWGIYRTKDPPADRLKKEFLNSNLVDIVPIKLMPTWDNSRTREAYIAKRIDRFILHSSIIDKMGMLVSSIGNNFTSDHRPIFLGWRGNGFRLGYSFKFNKIQLEDPKFNEIITNKWKELLKSDLSPFMTFREKVASPRKVAKDWQHQKRKMDKQELADIQKELDNVLNAADPNNLSLDIKGLIRNLEKRKQILLEKEEASWRLKSRAIWLKYGDRNTRFFHNFASARREKNSIWRISNGEGGFFYSDISNEATRFFQNQYKRKEANNFQDTLWGIELVPLMFDEAANESFFQPISEEELQNVIKAFKRDKIPGPDGWPIEFFSHFYDLFKNDLLRMVEASRMSESIHSIISSTLIALLPKKAKSDTFQDFRPISLCNILFKIISKIIAERLKPTLASFISKDQHAFLKGCNILDAVAMTQESLFSMISNKMDMAILKIDLQKAYDCLDWGFLRVMLTKIGLKSHAIDWIMSCVENARYSVIINGIPSSFFLAERGLRQGCPFSPLLFILAMNSLNLQINKSINEKRCRPIKICKDISLSHNLFVDDVLIFAMLCRAS